MGLDIRAASRLQFAGPVPSVEELGRLEQTLGEQGETIDDHFFLVYPNDEPWTAHLAGTEPGLYELGPESEEHDFRAGSYSSYGCWRDLLGRFAIAIPFADESATPKRSEGGPFVELIHFTDCDGSIGERVAAKLAKDFCDNRAAAERFAEALTANERDGFLSLYGDFETGFELAAQGGVLAFR